MSTLRFVLLLNLLFIISCKKDYYAIEKRKSQSEFFSEMSEEGEPTILGAQLPNPYLVENMLDAKESLDIKGVESINEFNISTSHIYVKFEPQNSDELIELYLDDRLILFDIPLDYEIISLGNWYREPNLDDNKPTPQYAVVPVDIIPSISYQYESLAELYIPEEDPNLIGQDSSANDFYIMSLVNDAHVLKRLPDEYDLDQPLFKDVIGGPRKPTGTITIKDDRLNDDIPIEGVEVKAHRWFRVYKTWTDENGEYYLNNSFHRPQTYTITFGNNDFKVADYIFSYTANIVNYSKVVRRVNSNYWSYNIDSGYENMQGHVFRAAYYYHKKNIDNLQRPRKNYGHHIIVAKNKKNENSSAINYIVLPILKIYRFNRHDESFTSDELFSTTIHELAHSSHVINSNLTHFAGTKPIIQESWAVAVEWHITKKVYQSLGISNYGEPDYIGNPPPQYPNHMAYQYWSPSLLENYTNLFINLIDDYNEKIEMSGYVDDNITGYSIKQLENIVLSHSKDLESLKIALKNIKPNNVSNSEIDYFISHYY